MPAIEPKPRKADAIIGPSGQSPAETTDGRHRRSERSRAKIIEAMLALVHAGRISPSAEDVALHAQVGIRSVFRHFTDMESLYREMWVRLESEFMEAARTPFRSTDWRGQLAEVIERRIGVFERIAPYRRAADAHQHHSPTLQADGKWMNDFLRLRLTQVLPPEITEDKLRLDALDMLLSFETWRRLRTDQKLPLRRAREIIDYLVGMIIPPG
jgi:AcrR family transcriptional regulator